MQNVAGFYNRNVYEKELIFVKVYLLYTSLFALSTPPVLQLF
jgi:hypothetical protein